MPLPDSVTTVTVRGTYTDFDGRPASGHVSFAPSTPILLSDGTSVLPTPLSVAVVNGEFTLDIPATDDLDVTPHGWSYVVVENIGSYHRVLEMLAPAGADIVLPEVAPAEPVTPEKAIYVRSVNGDTPDASGNVNVTAEVGSVDWTAVENKPTTFPPSAHTHAYSTLTGLPTIPSTPGQVGAEPAGAVAAHVAASDPHPQYLTGDEGDASYADLVHTHTQSDVTGLAAALAGKEATGTAASAVSAHVSATDPHTQYHTDTRGDARYYTKAQVDTSLTGKANTSSLAPVATAGTYASLTGKPTLAAVATTGSYTDLTNKPSSLGGMDQIFPIEAGYGYHSASIHPENARTASTLGGGWVTLVWVPAGKVISKAAMIVVAAATGTATTPFNAFAVYSSDGTAKLGETAHSATLFTATGFRSANLTTPVSASGTGRFVLVVVAQNYPTEATYALQGGSNTGNPEIQGGIVGRRSSAISSPASFASTISPTAGVAATSLPVMLLG